MLDVCPVCGGSGWDDEAGTVCSKCRGGGEIASDPDGDDFLDRADVAYGDLEDRSRDAF